jgi:hypothetical protein
MEADLIEPTLFLAAAPAAPAAATAAARCATANVHAGRGGSGTS